MLGTRWGEQITRPNLTWRGLKYTVFKNLPGTNILRRSAGNRVQEQVQQKEEKLYKEQDAGEHGVGNEVAKKGNRVQGTGCRDKGVEKMEQRSREQCTENKGGSKMEQWFREQCAENKIAGKRVHWTGVKGTEAQVH